MSNRSYKCLITGITGMVGSHLTDYLLANTNWKIYGMCRWRSPIENISGVIHEINKQKRLFLKYGDLTDQNSIDKVLKEIRPNIIFHLAAQSFPKTSFDESNLTYNTNILGTSRLLESVTKHNLDPIIHICSSSEVFGRVPKKLLPIKENCPYHPASPYAISKIGTDLIAKFFFEAYGKKILITRMFTHTGPRRGDVFAESSFAKQIAMIERGLLPPIVKTGNLDSLRTYADVRDAVEAYFLLVTKSKKFGEFYNIGGNFTCKVGEMLKFLIGQSTMKDKIIIKRDNQRIRKIDADLQVPDCSKFKKEFKWKPKYKFETTMIDLLNYWRARVKKNEIFIQR